MAGCGPVNIRPLLCATDAVTTCPAPATGATVTRVAASVSAVDLLLANPLRKMAIFWNDSTSTVYIKFGTGASPTSFTWKLDANDGFEMPSPVFTGHLTAGWSSATGALQITELI